jgi:hypothetical protein
MERKIPSRKELRQLQLKNNQSLLKRNRKLVIDALDEAAKDLSVTGCYVKVDSKVALALRDELIVKGYNCKTSQESYGYIQLRIFWQNI